MAYLSARRVEVVITTAMMFALIGAILLVLIGFTTPEATDEIVSVHLQSFAAATSRPNRATHIAASILQLAIELMYCSLQDARVIPEVLDVFTPLLKVNLIWPGVNATLGNNIAPSDLQDVPEVRLTEFEHGARRKRWFSTPRHEMGLESQQIVLAMTDPDAPSRDKPENSEFCHWIATGFTIGEATSALRGEVDELVTYKPPSPPPKTGKHRYVFVALVAKNGTTAKLNLREPGDRARWGYDEQRTGVRQWSAEMGLKVVGADFIYAENDEQ